VTIMEEEGFDPPKGHKKSVTVEGLTDTEMRDVRTVHAPYNSGLTAGYPRVDSDSLLGSEPMEVHIRVPEHGEGQTVNALPRDKPTAATFFAQQEESKLTMLVPVPQEEWDRYRKAAELANKLVVALEVLHNSPEWKGVWAVYHSRGLVYTGPNYTQELLSIKPVLSEIFTKESAAAHVLSVIKDDPALAGMDATQLDIVVKRVVDAITGGF